eukprot:UN03662
MLKLIVFEKQRIVWLKHFENSLKSKNESFLANCLSYCETKHVQLISCSMHFYLLLHKLETLRKSLTLPVYLPTNFN